MTISGRCTAVMIYAIDSVYDQHESLPDLSA
jgi:hypothetical protein